jgi:hypothetical protein
MSQKDERELNQFLFETSGISEFKGSKKFRKEFLEEKSEHPWATDQVIAMIVGDHMRKEKMKGDQAYFKK